MKVFIQAIQNPYSAYNLKNWSNPTSGLNLGKSKYGNTATFLTALYSKKVGGLLNGLSYKPWLDENGVQKTDSNGKNLTLQDKEEERWNLPKGYLSNKSWRKGDSRNESDMTYFQKSRWKLHDGTTVLDIKNSFEDAMFYYVCLESKYVANSERELRSKSYPHATHFISITNETDELAYDRKRKISKAISALENKALTSVWSKKFTHILQISSIHTALTDEQAYNLLYDYISADNGRTGHNIDKFMTLITQLKTDEGRATLDAKHLLQKAMTLRVVYEQGDTYTWNRAKGVIVLGDRYEDAIAFLLNPAKEPLVEELKAEIKSKSI